MNTSWGVKTKLYAMIGVIVAIVAVGGYFVTADLLKVRSTFELYEKTQNYYAQIRQAEMTITNVNLIAMDMLVDSSVEDFKGLDKKRYDELAVEKTDLDNLFVGLQKNAAEFAVIEQIASLKESTLLMYRNTEALGNALRTKRLSTEDGEKFDRAIDGSKNESMKKIEKLIEIIYAEFKSVSEKQGQAVHSLQKTMFGLVFVVLATLILVGFSTIKSLMASMSKVHTTMTKSTRELRQTSDRLADSSQKMATSTAESAAAIQESVSSMAEMTAMLKQTSQHTESASNLAQQILSKSDEGSRVMSDLSDSMTKIALANARLGDITKIIDDIRGRTNLINEIVFKTQLLSVNASIEAARAGHHGKGFSVVANEVANLATMSGKAANEIGTLLHESTSKVSTIVDGTSSAVKGGEHICKNAVQMFASISESIGEISDKVAQIDIATKEQETGIRQTSAALAQMNSATTSTSHVARDNAHLGSLLLKQCDRMVAATSLLNSTLYGETQAEGTAEVREPIAEARSMPMEDHQIEPDMDKVISLNQSELATVLIDKIKVGGTGSYKGTGTDG